MKFKRLTALILFSTALLFSRTTVGLNINTEDFELKGAMDISTFSEYVNGTMFVVDANYLNTENDNLLGVGLSAHNSFLGMEGFSLGLGARFVYLEDFMALPLAAEASYAVTFADNIPAASFSASLLYAPSVLTFDDGENYLEFRAEAAMEVINSVSLYVGYRDIETEYLTTVPVGRYSYTPDHGYNDNFRDETFNSSFYGGIKMSF
jgi:hypothetical protein